MTAESDSPAGPSAPAVADRGPVRPEFGPILAQLRVRPADADESSKALRECDPGPFTHAWDLRLGPAVARRGYLFLARGERVGSILNAVQYSDELTGVSGKGPGNDPVIAHFVLSGRARFENPTATVTVGPGQVVFRDTAKPWRFWFGSGTKTRMLLVPREDLLRHGAPGGRLPEIAVTDAGLAEARLLTGYLELARRFGDAAFTRFGLSAGQEAGVQLLLGAMEAAGSAVGTDFPNVTLAAAQQFIARRLDDPNLSPPMIARSLHTSVRTLHRAFREADDSVMGYVRRQRLDRARAELLVPGTHVGEVAARWHFSDTSHFIRQFKIAYGTTPASFVKEGHLERGDRGLSRHSGRVRREEHRAAVSEYHTILR